MREACGKPGTCALGIAFYPPAAVMEFYRTDRFLTRMITGLIVCDEHLAESMAAGAFALMPREHLKPIADVCARSSGTAVDMEATKVVRVELSDPDYLLLLKGKGGGKA
jgi:hypothetical protein